MRAILKFQNNEQATEFANAWSRATLGGHTLGYNNVTVFNVDDKGQKFIDNYVAKLNNLNH